MIGLPVHRVGLHFICKCRQQPYKDKQKGTDSMEYHITLLLCLTGKAHLSIESKATDNAAKYKNNSHCESWNKTFNCIGIGKWLPYDSIDKEALMNAFTPDLRKSNSKRTGTRCLCFVYKELKAGNLSPGILCETGIIRSDAGILSASSPALMRLL